MNRKIVRWRQRGQLVIIALSVIGLDAGCRLSERAVPRIQYSSAIRAVLIEGPSREAIEELVETR
jgi:hypothetical protein